MDQWEYHVEVFKNFEHERIRNELNRLGAEGWELVSVSTTVKAVTLMGNDLVCLLKRRGVGDFVDHNDGWG